jgi:hypothetical protein
VCHGIRHSTVDWGQIMNKSLAPHLSRRRVFAGAGSVGALAAAAAALPLVKPAASVSSVDASAAPDADGRYQATPHVLRYYQTAKV